MRTTGRRWTAWAVGVAVLSAGLMAWGGQAAVLLHTFTGGSGDGEYPYYGATTLSGANLYGMTYGGGADDYGVIFRMNTDGTGYTNLHEFAGGAGDGQYPEGSLTLSGTNFYGMAEEGGAQGDGVIFRMNTDGTGYTNLHEFAAGAGDGQFPQGSLTLSGTNLYGMTYQGGANTCGAVFRMNIDGTGYTNLHEFASGAGDGAYPFGDLTLSGTNLYGMAENGGANAAGVVFKMNMDGSGYTNLHEFGSTAVDAAYPYGSLTLSGATLYGMTRGNGAYGYGVIFKMNTDGSGYTNLHEFASGAGDGAYPYSSLTLSGANLYGMTYQGGANAAGVLFMIRTDGSSYANLYSFGGDGMGIYPFGTPTLSGSTLYGMAYGGGANAAGTVFALQMGLWSSATDLGSGWYWLDWFGCFSRTFDPWIWHVEHGWMYGVGTDVTSIWLWTADMGWLWTSDSAYPWLYRVNDATWLYYTKHLSPSATRWFYDTGTSTWESR